MPLSAEQEALCERVEKGESTPTAATVIRRQAREIDGLWDRLSRAYAQFAKSRPQRLSKTRWNSSGLCLTSDSNSKQAAKALQAACKDPERP